MKKFICVFMAAVTLVCFAPSCAPSRSPVTVASSDASDSAAWLTERLGEDCPEVVIGTDPHGRYGIDLTDFESDGYVIRREGDETVIFGKTEAGLDLAVRKFAKAVEKGDADSAVSVYHEGRRIKKLTIAGNDVSEYTIVYPAQHNENMVFAVGELQRLIEKATGIMIPAVEVSAPGRVIAFTYSDDAALENDGYVYTVKDGDLTFAGAYKRGCMYAVWRFLENELGWEGLTYGDSELISSEHVDVPEGTSKTETPAFGFLNMYRMYWGSYKNEKGSPTNEQNSYGEIPNACHGMQGSRFCDENYAVNQICYTDEGRYEECLENVIAYVDRRLAAGQVIGREFQYIDIAQGDNSGFCNCKECKKVFKEEGGNAGAMVRFSNRLSEEINSMYGDAPLYFLIFGYSGTNQAPKVTVPNEYLYVTVCFDLNCSNHLVDGSECTTGIKFGSERRVNSTYAEYLNGWSELTENIYVWFYHLDSTLMQYTALGTMYDDFRYFRDHNVRGVFWQCQFDGLGIQRVQHQLLAEMNWNMDMSRGEFDALLRNILEREYGDGWTGIYDYIDFWKKSQEMVDCWCCWGWTQHTFWLGHHFDETYVAKHFGESVDRFENAVALADSADQEYRVKCLSCHMYYEGIFSTYPAAYLAGDTDKLADLSAKYDFMIARLRECGFDEKSIYTVDGARVAFCDNLEDAVWIDWVPEEPEYYMDFIRTVPVPEKYAEEK